MHSLQSCKEAFAGFAACSPSAPFPLRGRWQAEGLTDEVGTLQAALASPQVNTDLNEKEKVVY